jgi:hypothetical protein
MMLHARLFHSRRRSSNAIAYILVGALVVAAGSGCSGEVEGRAKVSVGVTDGPRGGSGESGSGAAGTRGFGVAGSGASGVTGGGGRGMGGARDAGDVEDPDDSGNVGGTGDAGDTGGGDVDAGQPPIPVANPFSLWPSLSRDDLPAGFQFTEPTQPTTTMNERTATTAASLQSMISNGALLRLTASDATNWVTVRDVSDVDIVIDDGVTLGVVIINNSTNIRVRGAGPDSALHEIYVTASSDITVSSLLMRSGNSLQKQAIQIDNTHSLALIAIVARGFDNSAAAYFGATSPQQNFLIAGNNWGAFPNAGDKDWGVRFDAAGNVIVVDSQIEARGLQPVLRRSGPSPNHFYLRTTTINLYDVEATADVPSEGSKNFGGMYQRDCEHYVADLGGSGLDLRYGSIPDDNGHGSYESHDATWHTPASPNVAFVDPNVLVSLEANVDVWRFTEGTPSYDNTLTGDYDQMHPGWTAPFSPEFDAPMGAANPYDL